MDDDKQVEQSALAEKQAWAKERAHEQQETIHELSELFFVVQEMAQRLANETHGDTFHKVRNINEQLHLVRLQINEVKKEICG